jgi:hypothetical protein
MTTPEPAMPAAYDVLGSPEPAARTGGRHRNLLAGVVGAGAVAVAVAGSAVAFATFLGGGGAQPEDVLPADAMGMVKLDLDPAASQKVAVYRLAERFPATSDRVQDQDSVKDELLSALFEEADDVDYDRDVKPWIGDRVGAALVPGGDEPQPQPLVAIAFDDRAGAQAAMEQLQEEDDEAFFAFSDKADYVLLGTSQETVDDAATTEEVLAGSDSWEKGMDALDGDQIVTLWADLDAVYDALPQEAREEAASIYGLESDFELGGTFVLGAHAGDDHVEVIGRAIDLESPIESTTPVGSGRGSDLVAGLPEETVAAMSVTNLGAGLAELFDTAYGEEDPLGIVTSAEQFGLTLPDDLRTLLGEETVVGFFGEEDVAVRTRTDDVDAAFRTATALAEGFTGGGDVSQVLRRLDDGLAAGSTPAALDAISTDDGGLGDSDAFRSAVPDADEAGYLVYVDIARAIELAGQDLGAGAEDAAQLQSLGITGSGDAESSTFRMRLTVKD